MRWRITRSGGHLAALAAGLSALTFRYLQSVPADPDLWGHTKFGVDHIQSGHLARTDPFSFMTGGQEWINHEWLSELIFGWAYMTGGATGLFVLRSVIFCAIVTGLFTLCWLRWKNGFVTLLVATSALPFLALFTNVRPHSFTFLLVVLVLLCIEAYARGRHRWVYFLPLLMALWVNLHGGFIVGLGLCGLGLLSLACGAEGEMKAPTATQKRTLATVGLLTVAATLLNPYHLKLYGYLASALVLPREYVTEWMTLSGVQLVPYLFFTMLPLLVTLAARSWRHPTHLAFFVVSAVAALFNARFLAFLVIIGTLVLIDQGAVLWRRCAASGRYRMLDRLTSVPAVGVLAVVIALVSVPKALDDLSTYRGRVWLDPGQYPVGAAAFLNTHDLGPNLAVPFHWGEYAIWHLYPGYLVSQDGRYETTYVPSYVDSLLAAYYSGDLQQFVGGQDVDVMLLESSERLDRQVSLSDEWREVYRDATAAVYVPSTRAVPGGQRAALNAVSGSVPSTGPLFFP